MCVCVCVCVFVWLAREGDGGSCVCVCVYIRLVCQGKVMVDRTEAMLDIIAYTRALTFRYTHIERGRERERQEREKERESWRERGRERERERARKRARERRMHVLTHRYSSHTHIPLVRESRGQDGGGGFIRILSRK